MMGVDVHKSVLAWCVVSEASLLDEGELPNTLEGIKKLQAVIKKRQVDSVAMESTAQYHFKLLYTLIAAGTKVLLANPQQTKDTQGKKTDKLDAKRIAIAHRDGRLKPSVISPQEIMSLRKAMRAHTRMVEDQTKIKQRLIQVFHQKDVEFSTMLATNWGTNVLKGLFDTDDIDSLVKAHLPRGRTKQRDELIAALARFKDSMDEVERQVFRSELEMLCFTEFQKERLQLVYYQICKQNKVFAKTMQLLISIPGIGPDTAAKVIAEIVDIAYFPSPKQLVKWTGLAPRVHQSGHRKNITGRIHKGGNKHLRRAVVLACQNIYARADADNPLHVFARRKKEEKDAYWLALCAVARKLLVMIWYMWTGSKPWAPKKSAKSLEVSVKRVIANKLAMLERSVRRYEKVRDKLAQDTKEALRAADPGGLSPKRLVLALLESV
ncbi:MAG: IS110 family transposase [Candidatus Lokiarchaeota archaeon]|nr:IS110 family transposase [Candidatus Lokiarchaeota archaeon]